MFIKLFSKRLDESDNKSFLVEEYSSDEVVISNSFISIDIYRNSDVEYVSELAGTKCYSVVVDGERPTKIIDAFLQAFQDLPTNVKEFYESMISIEKVSDTELLVMVDSYSEEASMFINLVNRLADYVSYALRGFSESSLENSYKRRFNEWVTSLSNKRFNSLDKELDLLDEKEKRSVPKKSISWKGKKGWNSEILKEGYVTFRNHIGELDDYDDGQGSQPIVEPEVIPTGSFRQEDYDRSYEYFIDRNDFTTKDGVEKAERDLDYGENNLYDLKKECDLSDDWSSYYAEKEVLKVLNKKIHQAILDLELTSGDYNKNTDLMYYRLKNLEDKQARKQARKDNQSNRLAKYAAQALKVDNLELRDLIDDLGFLKEKKSWGVIKKYLDTEDGRIFKNLWVNQFK